MTEVELLREAAKTMRERANAATQGVWEADAETVGVVGEVRYVCDAFGLADKWPNAAHIASWHPAVALAVADWLEDEADRIDDVPYRVDSDWIERNYRAPLAVARAYLGGES